MKVPHWFEEHADIIVTALAFAGLVGAFMLGRMG